MLNHLVRSTALAALIGVSFVTPVLAQSMQTRSSDFNYGYGRRPGQDTQGIDPSTRDANGNRVILDGVIQTGSDFSMYARTRTSGAGDNYSGAGALGGATAIGNNLQVIVNGSHNTVIVDSVQTNNGNVTATATATVAGQRASVTQTAPTGTLTYGARNGVAPTNSSLGTLGASSLDTSLNGKLDLNADPF